jgi:hypothetical protein
VTGADFCLLANMHGRVVGVDAGFELRGSPRTEKKYNTTRMMRLKRLKDSFADTGFVKVHVSIIEIFFQPFLNVCVSKASIVSLQGYIPVYIMMSGLLCNEGQSSLSFGQMG